MSRRKNSFYIFGGQYERIFYGGAGCLEEARHIANKYWEFWDGIGWRKPDIYKADDIAEVYTDEGSIKRVRRGAQPVLRWNYTICKWEDKI